MFRWIRQWIEKRRDALMFERAVKVVDDGGQITATYPDGTVRSIAWDDVVSVEVHTNDSGPCRTGLLV